jgi:hypothetical protein
MPAEKLIFNGIDGASGRYLLPPMDAREVGRIARGEKLDPQHIRELKWWHNRVTTTHLGPKEGVDPKNLGQSGWGVVFAYSDSDQTPAILEALRPLLTLRQEQAGDRYREYTGQNAYRPGEAKSQFLARNGVGPGPADPNKMPYYLLVIGSPEAVPYRFQYQLDVQYAVGRLWFETVAEYDQYARSVVTAEGGQLRLPRRAALWGVENTDDPATRQSLRHLVQPVLEKLPGRNPGWQFESSLGADASKSRLSALMGGSQTPALLFTASHGMSFPLRDARQVPHQGALLCQDWPGPAAWREAIPQEFYFAGDDLDSTANLGGLIAFFFACYGAGTPQHDEFAKQAFQQQAVIAPQALLAQLPTAMLGHPKGGALAAVGHVERAWGYSFMWPGAGAQTTVFESTLEGLLKGQPVGMAVEYFNERYAELATELSDEMERLDFGKTPDPYELAGMWTANNDARGYAIIGDPAVRLPVVEADEAEFSRPALEPVTVVMEPPRAAADEPKAEEMVSATQFKPGEPGHAAPLAQVEAFTVLQGLELISRYAEEQPVSYAGLGDARNKVREVAGALTEALGNLASELATFSRNVTSLTVDTYISDDMTSVDVANPERSGAVRRASTRVSLDGDMQVVVPREAGALDESLWAIHTQMVAQAQANRAQMLRIAAEALTSLLTPVQKG